MRDGHGDGIGTRLMRYGGNGQMSTQDGFMDGVFGSENGTII